MSRRADLQTSFEGPTPWQIKRINSITGPVGTNMSDAIRMSSSVPGQTKVLWKYQEARNRNRRKIEDTSSKVSSIPPLAAQKFRSMYLGLNFGVIFS